MPDAWESVPAAAPPPAAYGAPPPAAYGAPPPAAYGAPPPAAYGAPPPAAYGAPPPAAYGAPPPAAPTGSSTLPYGFHPGAPGYGAPPPPPYYGLQPPVIPAGWQPGPPKPPSTFPSTAQFIAIVAAIVLVTGIAATALLRAGGTAPRAVSAPPAPPSPPGGTVAVVHAGPAVLTTQSLTGTAAGRAISLPGSPSGMVTTPDRTKAFLLDSTHGQIIPVDLTRGVVGTAIPVGKLPVDEHLSGDGATLFVTDNLSGAVIPIDVASGTARSPIPLAAGISGFVPSAAGKVVVATFAGSSGQPGIITFVTGNGLGTPVRVGTNSPGAVYFSPDGTTVWILESGVGNLPGVVIPVDVRTHAVGSPIIVGHDPSGAAMTPDGHLLVVANSIDATATIVDLTARVVVATVPVGAGPGATSITADGATAWVSCFLDRTLVPVDLRSGKAGGQITLTNAPTDISLSKSDTAAWVLFASSPGNATLLTGSAYAVGHAIPLGNSPSLVIAPDASTGWVANSLSDTVQHVDIAGNSSGPAIRVPRTPEGLVLTKDRKTLLVLSFGDGTHDGHLTAVDTASSKAGTPLAVGVVPGSLLLTPDGTTALITNHQSNAMTIVDVKRWAVRGHIALPCSPTGTAMTPDGATVYADCSSSSMVIPVTVKDGKVGDPIAVAPGSAIVMSRDGSRIFVNADHALQVIDVATNRVLTTKEETGNIVSLIPMPDGARLLAIDNTGAALLVVDATTLVTTKSIVVGTRPGGLQITPDGSHAYIIDSGEQKVYVVDVAGSAIATTVDVSPNAEYVVTPSRQP